MFHQDGHCIILLQRKMNDVTSRTYIMGETIKEAINQVVTIYETMVLNQRLIGANVSVDTRGSVVYDLDAIMDWIDKLGDISALVLDMKTNQYMPHGRSWIKTNTERILLKQKVKFVTN